MREIFNQILQLLQQGIAAIFRFVQVIWTWALDQVMRVTQVPWSSWPLWKQIVLVLVAAAIIYVLYRVGKELWEAGERILAGFASLLVVLVKTLPLMLIAGLIAFGGLWVVTSANLDSVVSYLPQSMR